MRQEPGDYPGGQAGCSSGLRRRGRGHDHRQGASRRPCHGRGDGWQILWPLILGFTLSAVIQAVVRREKVTALMSDDSPRALAAASGLGAASSSCSYASVAIARSLFRKGANFTAAMAFEIASTNLVLELGIILWLLIAGSSPSPSSSAGR